jgi:uncharacterized protein YndB with AHSA1/START domain
MATEPLTASVHIEATPEQVFEYFTSPEAFVRWMGERALLQPAPGGAFEVDINGVPVRGRYLEVDPPRRVVVSWGVAGSSGLPPGATQVEFTLSPTEAGTRLHLVHRNLPPDQAAMHGTGWGHFLGRLSQATAGRDPGPDPWNTAAS